MLYSYELLKSSVCRCSGHVVWPAVANRIRSLTPVHRFFEATYAVHRDSHLLLFKFSEGSLINDFSAENVRLALFALNVLVHLLQI